MKKIIFDVGHPVQVHHFKNLYWLLENRGWKCLFVARDKDITKSLLENYGLNYKMLSAKRKGIVRKIAGIPADDFRFFKIVKTLRPDFILNRFSLHSSHIAKLLRIVNIAFSDTEHASALHKLSLPLIDVKFTAESHKYNLGKNHLKYKGNIELFYLHPDVFTPDQSILNYLGVNKNEKYVIIRFVSWDAHHDLGEAGFSMDFKYKMAKELAKQARIFITSEVPLPPVLMDYQITIPPEKMHDALAFSALYIGEGGTMASEAACLGIPSVYVNSLDAGVFHDEEAYGLLHSFRTSDGALEKAVEILANPESKKETQHQLQKFLSEKINTLKLMEWFLEKYPESLNILQNNPDYQYKFK